MRLSNIETSVKQLADLQSADQAARETMSKDIADIKAALCGTMGMPGLVKTVSDHSVEISDLKASRTRWLGYLAGASAALVCAFELVRWVSSSS